MRSNLMVLTTPLVMETKKNNGKTCKLDASRDVPVSCWAFLEDNCSITTAQRRTTTNSTKAAWWEEARDVLSRQALGFLGSCNSRLLCWSIPSWSQLLYVEGHWELNMRSHSSHCEVSPEKRLLNRPAKPGFTGQMWLRHADQQCYWEKRVCEQWRAQDSDSPERAMEECQFSSEMWSLSYPCSSRGSYACAHAGSTKWWVYFVCLFGTWSQEARW